MQTARWVNPAPRKDHAAPRKDHAARVALLTRRAAGSLILALGRLLRRKASAARGICFGRRHDRVPWELRGSLHAAKASLQHYHYTKRLPLLVAARPRGRQPLVRTAILLGGAGLGVAVVTLLCLTFSALGAAVSPAREGAAGKVVFVPAMPAPPRPSVYGAGPPPPAPPGRPVRGCKAAPPDATARAGRPACPWGALPAALCEAESQGDPSAPGANGELGILQIKPGYWEDAIDWAAKHEGIDPAAWAYLPNVYDPAKCMQVVVWYAKRYGAKTTVERIILHNRLSTFLYLRRVQAVLAARDDGARTSERQQP